jgi:hypothetical protein
VIAFAEHLARLKRQFLELLDKDKEFRLAVAGYLGLSETLMRLESVEKSIEKLLEEVKRSREGQDKLWENVSRLWEEVNIYGASDDLCVVGEARVRASSSVVDEMDRKIRELRRLHPDKVRPRVLRVVYTTLAMPDLIARAEREGVWVLRAVGDVVRPRL